MRRIQILLLAVLMCLPCLSQVHGLDVIPYPNHVEFRNGTCNVSGASLKFKKDKSIPAEGYRMEITGKKITISSSAENGRR